MLPTRQLHHQIRPQASTLAENCFLLGEVAVGQNAGAPLQPQAQADGAPAAAQPTVRPAKSGNGADLGSGSYRPLGGAGAPPRRLARHLPVERDGATHYVAVDYIVAIHANAHYTHIFDGRDQLFCPLAIGEVESRLDTGRFARVHRSHIVNLDRVVGLKRAGDSGAVELPDRSTVPVSRSRLGWLKARLNQKINLAMS